MLIFSKRINFTTTSGLKFLIVIDAAMGIKDLENPDRILLVRRAMLVGS